MSEENAHPLVTIITVTYNLIKNGRAKQIEQCIQSVHNQSYPAIEHIIIDGASTDGTLELLAKHAENYTLKIYSEPDKGVYDAMNKGLRNANGMYINFLNSDDCFNNPDGISRSIEKIIETDADYSFGDAKVIKRNGKTIYWSGNIQNLPFGTTHYCHQTMIVNTEILRKIGGFNLTYKVAADSDVMIRLRAQNYKHVKVPVCFVTYRIGGLSLQQINVARADHSDSYYQHIGRHYGMTKEDCYLIWQLKLFNEVTTDRQIEIISKLTSHDGASFILRELLLKKAVTPLQKKRGIHPLLRVIVDVKFRKEKKYIVLFKVIHLLKISDSDNKRKYALLGFIPVIKTQRSI